MNAQGDDGGDARQAIARAMDYFWNACFLAIFAVFLVGWKAAPRVKRWIKFD